MDTEPSSPSAPVASGEANPDPRSPRRRTRDRRADMPTPVQHTAGYALHQALVLRGWRCEIFMESTGEYLTVRLPDGERICVSGTTRAGREVMLTYPTHEHASWQAQHITGPRSRPRLVYDSQGQGEPAPFGGDTAALITAIAMTARERATERAHAQESDHWSAPCP